MQHSQPFQWNICARPEPNLNEDKSSPALSAEKEPKECQMREDEETSTAIATTSLPIIQVELGQPVLFENVKFPTLIVHEEAAIDPGKERQMQDTIYIALPSFIQEANHLKGRCPKGDHFRMCPNPVCKSCNPLKKINSVIAKHRKLSKLNRITLLHHVMKAQAQANRQKRQLFDAAKYQAISRAVDAIGIDALMITNPDTDMDCTKRMSELSVYDKNYQRDASASSSQSQRPDLIIDKLTSLKLEKKEDEESVSAPSTACQGWRSWHTVTPSNIFSEEKDGEAPNCSRNFSEYCVSTARPFMNKNLANFLKELRRLQVRIYRRNLQTGGYKKLYCSVKEAQKHVELKKVKFLVLKSDVEKGTLSGGVNEQIKKVIGSYWSYDVIVCFAPGQKKVGYYMHRRELISCVGVSNYDRLEELLKDVLVDLVRAMNDCYERIGKPEKMILDLDTFVSEDFWLFAIVKHLIKVLTPVK